MSRECIQHGDWDDDYCGPECERLTRVYYTPITSEAEDDDE